MKTQAIDYHRHVLSPRKTTPRPFSKTWTLGLLASAVACTSNPTPITPGDAGATSDAGVVEDAGQLDQSVPDKDAGEAQDSGAADLGTAQDGGPGPRYTWWQDVEPIVREKCQLCHQQPPQFGAPRAFVDYAHTQGPHSSGAEIHEVMAFRINAQQNRMPPTSQPQLTEEERNIITVWSQIGAPEGTPPQPGTDAGVSPDAGMVGMDAGMPARPISRSFDILATQPGSSAPYQLPVRDTSYTCWSFTVPQGMSNEEYAFRFEPVIDNTVNTHHTLLFHSTEDDHADGEPFGCGGFPLSWSMIAGWAPGRTADEIPAGAGVPINPGDKLILQVHYDNVSTQGITDNSGVRVLMTDEPNLTEAGILWSGVVWATPLNGQNVQKRGTCTINSPTTMFAVFPHMHQVGTRITMEVRRQGQQNWTTLVDIQGWSFEDQPNVPISPAEQQFNQGDELRTTCWWNTGGQSVGFGEASDDEMCFNFVYHYPVLNNANLTCVSASL